MTAGFDPADHPRGAGGRFAAKAGSAPAPGVSGALRATAADRSGGPHPRPLIDVLGAIVDDDLPNRSTPFNRLIAEYGRHYKPPPLARRRPGGSGRCFEEAHRLAEDQGWDYVEGWARPVDGSELQQHAWVVRPDGAVKDPAWGTALAYRGVVVPDYVRAACLRRLPALIGFGFADQPENLVLYGLGDGTTA